MTDNVVLINFIDLTLEEKKRVLSWRNHPDVKRWMYNNDTISFNEHLNFIDSLRTKQDKLYFIVQQNSENIGVIDFTDITSDNLNIGLYAVPSKKGIGTVLIEIIIDFAFNKLHVKKISAELLCQNTRASHLYKKYGFTEIDKKNVNSKEFICMELTHENR